MIGKKVMVGFMSIYTYRKSDTLPQLRDCQYAIDAGDRIFAPGMKRLLLRAFIIHRQRENMDDTRLLR